MGGNHASATVDPRPPCSLSFRLPPRLGYSNCVTGGRVKFDRWPSVGVLRILITFGHTTLNSDLPGWQTIQQKRNLTFQEIIKRKRKKKGRPSTRKQNIDLIRSLISREGSEKTILVTNRSYKKKIWAKYGKNKHSTFLKRKRNMIGRATGVHKRKPKRNNSTTFNKPKDLTCFSRHAQKNKTQTEHIKSLITRTEIK